MVLKFFTGVLKFLSIAVMVFMGWNIANVFITHFNQRRKG